MTMHPPTRQLVLPAQVTAHELVRVIGQGSFGEVWLGRTIIGSYRAIKVVCRQKFEDARPFEREFAGLRKFEPISRTHPGLVAILQVGRDDDKGYFYYVMEVADDLVRGQDIDPQSYRPKNLRHYLEQQGRLAQDETLRIALALVDALGHIHEKKLVHRDVKPSNIIFVQGVPKLADIGLVTRIEEATGLDGTMGYVPPEGPGTPAADIFAFGKVLYQMVMGKTVREYPELPPQVDAWEDKAAVLQLNDIIHKCCALQAEQRYANAAQVRAALLGVQQTLPAPRPRARKSKTTAPANKMPPQKAPPPNFRVVILYSAAAETDRQLLLYLDDSLRGMGFHVYHDSRQTVSLDWAREIRARIEAANAVLVLLSETSVASEMLSYEVELAYQAAQQHQKPLRLVPVRLRFTGALPSVLAGILDPLQTFHWEGPDSNGRLLNDLGRTLEESKESVAGWSPVRLESVGGAVPLVSEFYIERASDGEFEAAVGRRDSIVLVKGPRQIGKTSLLARALEEARAGGARVVLTDFQKFNASHLATLETLFLTFAEFLADQLELEADAADVWDKKRSPNTNFERYLKRHVVPAVPGHVVWALDEVDRLFTCSFGSEVFGLFRAWHNERALNPSGPWSRLTLVMAYATEAHLFITDVNQSPFNVGTRLALEDFTLKEVAELNRRYASILPLESDLRRLYALLAGHPYLLRRAFNELAGGKLDLARLIETADHEEGIFADHLRYILVLVGKDQRLMETVRAALGGSGSHADTSAFYRLRSAGVLGGDSVAQPRLRCELYARYLRRHLLR